MIDCLILYKITDKIIKFEKTIEKWRMELTGGEKTLTEVKIQRDIQRCAINITIYNSNDILQSHT